MEELIRLLREFPAIWASIGGISVAALLFIFSRKLSPVMRETISDMATVHKLQMEEHEKVLKIQRDHYESELQYEREQFKKIESERNDYRNKLHDEKAAHQSTMLQVTELSSRPNVDQVYAGQQDFFKEMTKFMLEQTNTLKAIHQSIVDHDKGIEERTSQVVEKVLKRVGK